MSDERLPQRSSGSGDGVRLEFTDPNGERVWALYSQQEEAPAAVESAFSLYLQDIPSILQRQKWVIAITTAVVMALGVIYLFTATKIYGAGTEVLVERRDSALGEFARVTVANNAFLATQAEIIHSQTIVEPALATLPFDLSDDPEADPVRIALASLSVSPVHGTDVLAIHYRGVDAEKGVWLLDAVLDQYRAFLSSIEFEGHSGALDLLREREHALGQQVAELEEEYKESVRRSGSLDASGSLHEVDQEMLELHAKRAVEAANLRRDLETEYQAFGSALGRGEWSIPNSVADAHLLDLLNSANSELALLLVTHGPNHPDIRGSRRKVEILQKQLSEQMASAIQRARLDERRLGTAYQQKRHASGSRDVERRNQERLRTEIARLADLHMSAVTVLADKELTVGALGRSGVQVRVLKSARIASDQLWPRPGMVLLPCLVIGVLGGGMLGLARDREGPMAALGWGPTQADSHAEPPHPADNDARKLPARIVENR